MWNWHRGNDEYEKVAASNIQMIDLALNKQLLSSSGTFILDLQVSIASGEFITLFGPSGAGKSTLLRCLAGLDVPDSGCISVGGKIWFDSATRNNLPPQQRRAGYMFQDYALFPNMSVRGNLEFAQPPGANRKRVEELIELMALGGMQQRKPATLSGGQQQRVALARALAAEPELLLLDEPFSALDVLTAETLRGDIMDLWVDRRVPTKGIIFVSHNIEEAVEMADRIIVFGSDPGCIRAEIPVPMPRPRDWSSPAFRRIVDEVYTLLTTVPGREATRRGTRADMLSMQYRLPDASIQQLVGLLDALTAEPFNGRADLPHLAGNENLATDDLMILIEALQLLGFAQVGGGDIEVTPVGRTFVDADLQRRKQLFADSLVRNIGFIAHIRRVLDERPGHAAPEARFLGELEDHLSEEEAQRVLETVINWGRYAELFAYDYDRGVLSLENP
jgi:NitT/TauT family transport system ATP-binding protein